MPKASKNASQPTSLLPLATQHCKAYRDHIRKQYGARCKTGYNSYLFTREDLMRILYDTQGEQDGIRIYIGFEDEGKGPLVRLYTVPCKRQGTKYHDQLGQLQPASGADKVAAVSGADNVRSGRPCPSECGGTNMLNS